MMKLNYSSIMQWKGQKTAEISTMLLKLIANLEILVNQV